MNRKQRRAQKKAAKNNDQALSTATIQKSIEQDYAAAIEHHHNGRLAEAEAGYRNILTSNANIQPALLSLSAIFLQSGRFDEAINLMQRLIVLQPDHAGAYSNMGSALRRKGLIEKAIKCFEKSIAINPNDANSHNNLANALSELELFSEAILSFNKAIEVNPGYVGAYYNRGMALRSLFRVEEAAASFHKATTLAPDFPEAYFKLAKSCYELGKTGDAIDHCCKAITIRPAFDDAWNQLASATKANMHLNPQQDCNDSFHLQGLTPKLCASRHFAIYEHALNAFLPHRADASYDKVIAMMPTEQVSPKTLSKPPKIPERTVALLHFGRSGTGLMHSLIDNHPEISTLPSYYLCGYFNAGVWEELASGAPERLPERFADKFAVLFDATSPKPIPAHLSEGLALIGIKDGMTCVGDNHDEVLTIKRDLFITEARRLLDNFSTIGPGLFLRIIHAAYEHALGRTPDRHTIFYHIHNPGPYAAFNFLSQVPDARLMMMIRRPVQSCESWVREPASDNSYGKICQRIITMLFGVDAIAFRRQDSIGVRLEDLKARPEATMQAVCDWVGIKETPSLYEMTAQGKKWWGDPSSPDYDKKGQMSPFDDACVKRPTGSVFGERDRFLLETLFYPFNVRFGYSEPDPDGFRKNLKEVRAMLDGLLDFEQAIINNTDGDPDLFMGRGDFQMLRAVMTDRLDILDELGTYPHMLNPLDIPSG
jgi:tetratricopeptide (TPR) repeat protein